jgi:hypothetical protein
MRSGLAATFLALSLGCTQPVTQLIVVVDTDYAIPAGLDELSVAVRTPEGALRTETEPLDGAESLPFTLAVVPESLERLGPLEIEALGSREGTERVRRRARVTLVRGETLTLLLHLLRACEGAACPEGETCGLEGCEPIDAPVYPWGGVPPRLGQDAGAAFDVGPLDASARDAATIDAGPSEVGPADTGPLDASDGGPGCTVLGCDDDNVCTTDVCAVDGTCTHVENAVACDDGAFCNGLDTCRAGACSVHAGNPCGGGTACDEETGACLGCVDDSTCPAAMQGAWGECGGFADACAASGTEARMVRTFSCVSGVCVASDTTEERACSRSTDGSVCGASSCGLFGACEGTGCALAGTQSRTCVDRVCEAGICASVSRTESAGCARDTEGDACGANSCTVWSACAGFSGTCGTTGTQSRTCTSSACAGGACRTTSTPESRACSRITDGVSCGATVCSSFGACTFASECATTGSQSRTCTDSVCARGACGLTTRTESAACSRASTDGLSCRPGTVCDPWGLCGGFSTTCDETGTETRRCTTYSCSAGLCSGTAMTESQACTRDTDGAGCGTGRCCAAGSCGLCVAPL